MDEEIKNHMIKFYKDLYNCLYIEQKNTVINYLRIYCFGKSINFIADGEFVDPRDLVGKHILFTKIYFAENPEVN